MSLSEVGFGDASASSCRVRWDREFAWTRRAVGVSGRTSAGSHILNLIARLPRMTFPRHARARGAPGRHRAAPGGTSEADTFGSRQPGSAVRRPIRSIADTFDSRYVRPFGSAPAKTEAARRTFVPFDPSIAGAPGPYTCEVRLGDRPAYPLRRESRRARWRVKSGYRVLFACCGVKNKNSLSPLTSEE